MPYERLNLEATMPGRNFRDFRELVDQSNLSSDDDSAMTSSAPRSREQRLSFRSMPRSDDWASSTFTESRRPAPEFGGFPPDHTYRTSSPYAYNETQRTRRPNYRERSLGAPIASSSHQEHPSTSSASRFSAHRSSSGSVNGVGTPRSYSQNERGQVAVQGGGLPDSRPMRNGVLHSNRISRPNTSTTGPSDSISQAGRRSQRMSFAGSITPIDSVSQVGRSRRGQRSRDG